MVKSRIVLEVFLQYSCFVLHSDSAGSDVGMVWEMVQDRNLDHNLLRFFKGNYFLHFYIFLLKFTFKKQMPSFPFCDRTSRKWKKKG